MLIEAHNAGGLDAREPTFLPFPAYLAYGEHFSPKQPKC